jgi:hypothetical protein
MSSMLGGLPVRGRINREQQMNSLPTGSQTRDCPEAGVLGAVISVLERPISAGSDPAVWVGVVPSNVATRGSRWPEC